MTKRTTITLPKSLRAQAEELMKLRQFTDFSGFLQTLIREEHERRRSAPLMLTGKHDH